MRAALYNLLKSLGFDTCEACEGSGVVDARVSAMYPGLGETVDPSECPVCEGAGVVRKTQAPMRMAHDDFRPEGP